MSDETTELHELEQQRRQREDELERAKESERNAELIFYQNEDSGSAKELEEARHRTQRAHDLLNAADYRIEQARERKRREWREAKEAEIEELKRKQAELDDSAEKLITDEIAALRKAHETRKKRQDAVRESQSCEHRITRIQEELRGVELRHRVMNDGSNIKIVLGLDGAAQNYLTELAEDVYKARRVPR